jgi:hypothetical protein
MKHTTYAKLTARLIAAWFLLVLGMSALHLFRNPPNTPPLALGLAVLIPLSIFAIWFTTSAGFREFTLDLDRSVLTMVHTWRVGGFVFLVLYTYHLLPGVFALPAGWGDIAMGVTAPWAARRLSDNNHRGSFMVWQVFGMIDLVAAVALGTTASLLDPTGISTKVMSELPMSLIPTFGVPLLLILHIICIAQSVQRRDGSRLLFGRTLSATS